MEKGSDSGAALLEAGMDSFDAGSYPEALSKLKAASRLLQTEEDIVTARLCIIACHHQLGEHGKAFQECLELEPTVARVYGQVSVEMARLMRRRADALRDLKRLDEAESAARKSLKITKEIDGHSRDHIQALNTLANILREEGKFEEGLKHIEEARSLFKPEFSSQMLVTLLGTHASMLVELERYRDALPVRLEALALSLRLNGPNHPIYAITCGNAAFLYGKLNQMQEAVKLTKQALAIYTKTFGPSNRRTKDAQQYLAYLEKAPTDPAAKKIVASKSHRMCNADGCGLVTKNMNRCLKCLAHYLCKEHEGLIHEHVVVCPKFPDVLPDEEKLERIVKCRRCRKEGKEGKLMKCAVCESVKYCSAKCQKEDWKRHKVFCGKKN